MVERTYRTRIDDLARIGEELSGEQLKLVAGAAGKKLASGGGGRGSGTRTIIETYVYDGGTGAPSCEADDDD